MKRRINTRVIGISRDAYDRITALQDFWTAVTGVRPSMREIVDRLLARGEEAERAAVEAFRARRDARE
jgi:hypothetical protein